MLSSRFCKTYFNGSNQQPHDKNPLELQKGNGSKELNYDVLTALTRFLFNYLILIYLYILILSLRLKGEYKQLCPMKKNHR